MTVEKTNKELTLGAMYKHLVIRLRQLITRPKETWKIVFEEKKTINEILSQYSLPLIGISTLAVFIGYLLSHQDIDFQSALKESIFTFASFFFSLYVIYFILNKVMPGHIQDINKENIFKIVALPYAIIYLTGAVIALIPETIVIGHIINLYIVYLIWIAIDILYSNSKDTKVMMTAFISFLILIVPNLILRLFFTISEFAL